MRFLRLNLLLPLIAGVLLVISTIFLAMDFLGPELDDITEELGGQCSPSRSQLSRFTYCHVDEFSFSNSYEIITFLLGGICERSKG